MRVMEKVLVITHVASEGPGTLGDFLMSRGFEIETVRLFDGQALPGGYLGYHAVVTMGGSMNVHDDEHYPFLAREVEFLSRAISENVPVLGICLGAQLIARACYAPVRSGAGRERGWKNIFVTDEGRKDIILQGVPALFRVFQWHDDVFEVPAGGVLIATARNLPNQAFRYRNAYGLQFHVEVTRDMLAEWMDQDPDRDEVLRTFDDIEKEFSLVARALYANFLWLADIRRRVGSPAGRITAGV